MIFEAVIKAIKLIGYVILFPFEKIGYGVSIVIDFGVKIPTFFTKVKSGKNVKTKKSVEKVALPAKKSKKKESFVGKILIRSKALIKNFVTFVSPIFSKISTFLSTIFARIDENIKKLIKTRKDVKPKKAKEKKFEQKKESSKTLKPHKVHKKSVILERIFSKLNWFLFGFCFATFFIFTPFYIYKWFRELPSPDMLLVDANRRSTKIFDRNGKLLYEIYVDRKYDPVSLDQIPDFVINATVAVEDDIFYSHIGLRPDSILRAARETFLAGNMQGGSTITQQLVKNILLTPERTFSRKIKEAVLSLLVEAKYSKDEIMEMYLNNIPYGGTAWGIQSASQKYFGKNVWELDLAEATLLAGLPSAPSAYSPLTDLDLAKGRQKLVLNQMVRLGYISQDEADLAFGKELIFAPQEEFIRAPHFVNFVRKELEKMYGKRYVEMGGLSVYTTLDVDLQDKVQKIVAEEVENNTRFGFTNGAAVVLDAKNSEILAYVGSIDYFREGWGAYDVVTAYRQPGSSIKPVTYALALASGFTPASVIEDKPIIYKSSGAADYKPVNYDGNYHGNVTLRAALANSYNIPAVKLAYSVGADNIVKLGRDMGLKNWVVGDGYGLSITLGGKEVRLLDHANVYATFARKGMYKDTTPFLYIKDNKGYEIYNFGGRPENRVLSEEVSYLIWNILSDNAARVPAFGSGNALVVPGYKVAVKTGTTDLIKDNWTMGYTPSYVVGVWVGNNDSTAMNRYLASGVTGAAPIWNRVMSTVLEEKNDEIFDMPSGVFTKYDKDCGRSEVFIKGSNVPDKLCPKADNDEEKKGD